MTQSSKKLPWSKFIWKDYKSDEGLKQVSLAAQGLWMRMLCIMHEADPYGHLLINGHSTAPAQLARSAGCSADEAESLLGELEASRVFSRTEDGVIYSRRMIRDREEHLEAQAHGRRGGNPLLIEAGRRIQNAQAELIPEPLTPPLNLESESDSPPTEGGKPPPPPVDLFGPVDPKPPTPAKILCTEGLAIIGELTGKLDDRANRALLGRWRGIAKDDERLLKILLDAREKPPIELVSWVTGCLNAPRLVIDNSPAKEGDPWSVSAFCSASTHAFAQVEGQWILEDKWVFNENAKQVAMAARFPGGRTVDWTWLVDWLRAGFSLKHDIIPTITRMVGVFSDTPTSLRAYDKAIRERKAAA